MAAKTIKRLYLSSSDRKLTGLCGGIADYFEIDPSMVRLAWVVITILSGIIPGIIAYFIASIVIPKQPTSQSVNAESAGSPDND